ncbi:MAG: aminoacyl-tRNA hydrolase [Patescibacteria group bacterium]
MKIIVGLGNPGEKYNNTRHNVGFMFVDTLATSLEVSWSFDSKFNAYVAKSSTNSVLLVKPQTYMNLSGESVAKVVNFYKVDFNDLIVVHDDVDLEFGKIRYKKNMGAAGHHGVEDIIQMLSEKSFWRIRIGVGRPNEQAFEVHDYVLSKFNNSELLVLNDIFKHLGNQILQS